MRQESLEDALLELGTALHGPHDPKPEWRIPVVALAHRSHTLYDGFLSLVRAGRVLPARTLTRPLVEANILLRFIGQHPEHRTALWRADGVRYTLTFEQRIRDDPHLLAKYGGRLTVSEEEVGRRKEFIEEAREAALKAGVPGVSRRGALLPNIAEQVRLLNHQATTEAYVFGYGPGSNDIHMSHFAFRDAVLVELEDGRAMFQEHEDGALPELGLRQFGAAAFASTLVVVGSMLGIGIDQPAERLRARLMGEDAA